jgi:nicotinamidase-related amidase
MVEQVGWRERLSTWRLPIPDFEVDRSTTALLIIDMQYHDAHPDYGLGKLLRTVDPARASYYFARLQEVVIPNIKRLLDFFRSNSLRVIYLTVGSVLEDGSDLSPDLRRRYLGSRQTPGSRTTFPKGTFEHSILAELTPRDQELVINKTANGAFNSSDIERTLRNMRVQSLILTGVGTDACVETTARDAVDRGFDSIVVEDACATLDQESHNASLVAFAKWFGGVESTSAVIALLSKGLSA